MAKQIIRIKPDDLKEAVVRGFGRSAWEAGKSAAFKDKVQANKKKKEPRYKNRFHGLEQ